MPRPSTAKAFGPLRHPCCARRLPIGSNSMWTAPMLLVADVAEAKRCQLTGEQQHKTGLDRLNVCRSMIPAVTHVDDSARVQTVHHETNPRFHDQIARFRQLTGCPSSSTPVSTSAGNPLCVRPRTRSAVFTGTEIDLLAVGNCLLRKENQPPGLLRDSAAHCSPTDRAQPRRKPCCTL